MPHFKVDEFDVYDEGTELNSCIEMTRWFGSKMRLFCLNMLDLSPSRDRMVYVGRRELSPVEFHKLRTSTDGTGILLMLSGAY